MTTTPASLADVIREIRVAGVEMLNRNDRDTWNNGYTCGTQDAAALVERYAAQAAQAEPEYWQWRHKGDPWRVQNIHSRALRVADDAELRHLYTAPPAAAQAERAAPDLLAQAIADALVQVAKEPPVNGNYLARTRVLMAADAIRARAALAAAPAQTGAQEG